MARRALLVLAGLCAARAVQIVMYDDGPDQEALVDLDSMHTTFSFLQTAAAAGPASALTPPVETAPQRINLRMKNQCCDAEGCCAKRASSMHIGPDGTDASFLEVQGNVRSSFLETDSTGRLTQARAGASTPRPHRACAFTSCRAAQVNQVCCGEEGGAARAGGGGPGGDQFAAASVPAVPCVCVLLSTVTSASFLEEEGGVGAPGEAQSDGQAGVDAVDGGRRPPAFRGMGPIGMSRRP